MPSTCCAAIATALLEGQSVAVIDACPKSIRTLASDLYKILREHALFTATDVHAAPWPHVVTIDFACNFDRRSMHPADAAATIDASRAWELRARSVLVIDGAECYSSVDMKHVDDILRLVRKTPDKPFGGMTLLLCGDFPDYRGTPTSGIAYAADACGRMAVVRITGASPVTNGEITDLRNELPIHQLTRVNEIRRQFMLMCPLVEAFKTDAVFLTMLPHTAAAVNRVRLDMLPGEDVVYPNAFYEPRNWDLAKPLGVQADPSSHVPLAVRIGARVVFTDDVPGKANRGLVGRVTGFATSGDAGDIGMYPVVDTEKGEIVAAPIYRSARTVCGVVSQWWVPLRLSWALSLDATRGMKFDTVVVERDDFSVLDMWSILARVRSLDGLHFAQ